MRCTKIGGTDKNKSRISCFARIELILSGGCSLLGCSLYAYKITSEFYDPMVVEMKYELGAALFIGWAGSILCILGGIALCFSSVQSPKVTSNWAVNQPPLGHSSSIWMHHFDKKI